MKTILYARCTHPNPEAIRQQLVELKSYADYMGYTDCEQIIDDGKSGTGINDMGERPGLCQLMDMVEEEDIANVIVKDLSRLSRNMTVLIDIIAKLHDRDVRLIAVEDDYDSMMDKYRPDNPLVASFISICEEMQYRRRHRMEYTKWGLLHKRQLLKKRPALYDSLFECARLDDYLDIISDIADHRIRKLLQDMRVEEGLPECPSSDNKREWTRRMDELYKKAALIVRREIIEI